jgi:hypothetical protein
MVTALASGRELVKAYTSGPLRRLILTHVSKRQLTAHVHGNKGAAMRHTLILPLSILSLAVLSACNQAQPEGFNETIADPMENQLANAAPVALPPALKASKTYRCKDNSLIYVDFFADDLTANIRTEKEGAPVKLTAPEKGKAFAAEGYSIEGSGATITASLPGKGSQSCKG